MEELNKYSTKTTVSKNNKLKDPSDLLTVQDVTDKKNISNLDFKNDFQGSIKKISNVVSYFELFRYATRFEKFLIILAVLCSICGSLFTPYVVIIYGEYITLLIDRTMRVGTSTKMTILNWFGGGQILTNPTEQEANDAILKDSFAFAMSGFAITIFVLVFSALGIDLLNFTAYRQIKRIKIMFFESILRQDMIWYDTNTSENFATRVTEDLDKLKEGIGEKLSICLNLIFSFLIAMVVSFFYGWKLTLVIIGCAPIIILMTAFTARIQVSLTQKELKSYSSAGNVAEEVLASIRTVFAFGGQEKELDRYKKNLHPAELNGKKKGLFSGISAGVMWIIIYGVYALAFWYGIILILDDRDKVDKEYTPAVLIIVLYGVLGAAQNLGMTSPLLEIFAAARGSAYSIFKIIDRKPIIDSLSENGLKPKSIDGNIRFSDVRFNYPARSDVQVLNGLNLEIKSGQTIALVGPSGCGKSTCLQLIQRLYDPLSGSVEIDGVKLSELNIQWIRSKIGVVGQEPVLFATTIRENIRYGNPSCTDEEIEDAARIANCHHFISKLPNGYDTLIGERGAQLSGGQKQRIAIARALVRNPRILLLDEATSALDPTSEKRVQNALERASKGRTTVVVSHRLSTIFNADKIVLIKEGVVMEEGSHAELMKAQGTYYDLVKSSQKGLTNKTPENTNLKTKLLSETNQTKEDCVNELEDEIESEEIEAPEENFKISNYRLFKMNSPEWPYITLGCLGAVIMGASFPACAILFGDIFGNLSLLNEDDVKRISLFYSILFLALGLVTGLAVFFKNYMFSVAGVRLTSRLRIQTFEAMMKQEIAWYDDTKNAVGALCSRLSSDCSSVQGATGSRIGSFLQAGSVIFIGIGISLYYSWKITLVASISIPLVLIIVFLESRFMQKVMLEEKTGMENGTRMAVEAISNIRTIAGLCHEIHILNRYKMEVENVYELCRKKSRMRGIVFGLGKTIQMICYAISFWYGGTLIVNKEINYEDAIKVGEALIFGSWMLGQALGYAPNISEGIISASRIFNLIDREPKICKNGNLIVSKDKNQQLEGNVMYSKVGFRYPNRPAVIVLNGLDLSIQRGQTVALVGPSGCGKSTCMQLLLRYYDPDEGKIDIDGIESTDFPLDVIRSHLGIVSQEPVLFDRTIAENIAYGDNSRTVIMAEIIQAAKTANIHAFIMSLPLQYDTGLGTKGTQLSGGQKQRIAIARALVRNPKILLLDEATSALDTHSEKVVQVALDNARCERTCIVIAHRLTTIQNADLICVIENGHIVEKGTHDQLMKKGEKYATHYEMQLVD